MQFTDRAIILGTIAVRDKGMVVHTLSFTAGKTSYYLGGTGNKKKGKFPSLLHPGAILKIFGQQRAKSSLGQLVQYHPDPLLPALRHSISSSAIVLFCCDVISTLLPEGYVNEELFAFFESFLKQLNANDTAIGPLYFCFHLAQVLGFELTLGEGAYFDYRESSFRSTGPTHPDYISGNSATLLRNYLLKMSGHEPKLNFSREERSELLATWIRYLQIHSDTTAPIKSLSVLQSIFQ